MASETWQRQRQRQGAAQLQGLAARSHRRRLEFARLVKDISVSDLASLVNFGFVADKVKKYIGATREVVPLDSSDFAKLGWPLVWLLGRYSNKHIFLTRRAPNIVALAKQMRDFEQRVYWRWVFRKDPGSQPQFRVKGPIQRCYAAVPPELRAWCARLRSSVIGAAGRARAAARFNPVHVNASAIDRAGLRLLRASRFQISKSDKEPGFTIAEPSDYNAVVDSLLHNGAYEEVSIHSFSLAHVKKTSLQACQISC